MASVYQDYQSSGSVNSNTHTYTTMGIGAADSDRWVIAAFYTSHNTSREFGTVTIGGVSATLMADEPTLTAEGIKVDWWKANVTTGTTGNVVVTTPASTDNFYDGGCATYRCDGEPTSVDTALDTATTGSTFETTVDVNAGGSIIAVGAIGFTGEVDTWTGVSNDNSDATNHIFFGSSDGLSAETGRAVDLEVTNTFNFNEILGVMSFDVAGGSSADALLADDVESASEVSAPVIGQQHSLGATSIQASTELTAPTLTAVSGTDALTADDVESTSETSAPTLGQQHALGANDAQSTSEVTAPAIGQAHSLTAASVESSAEVTAPTLSVADTTDELTADDVEANSEVTSPALGQIHALLNVGVTSQSELSSPRIDFLSGTIDGATNVSLAANGAGTFYYAGENWREI